MDRIEIRDEFLEGDMITINLDIVIGNTTRRDPFSKINFTKVILRMEYFLLPDSLPGTRVGTMKR